MKIYAFADESSAMIDQQIEAMHRNGLAGLEIRNVDGTNVSAITLDKAKEVRRKLDDAGLITWSVGSPIGKIHIENDDFPAHLEMLRHMTDVAHILGTENIRMFSFFLPQDKDPELYREEVIDRLGKMLDIAQAAGVELCHENERGIYGDIAPRCLTLHQALPRMKGVFDAANYLLCGQEAWSAWEMLHPYIKYMHIKDARADGKIVPAGYGEGKLDRIIAAYRDAGGCALSVEPHLYVFDGLAGLDEKGSTHMIDAFVYPTPAAAFDAACTAVKALV